MLKVPRHWRTPKAILVLFVLEFAGTVAALALFGIASPDLYRTDLWKDGGLNGFNSDPILILYDYANYRTPRKTPLVWSQFITDFNVAISVLSMFILLVKSVLWVMHLFFPIVSLVLHMAITALWAVSVYGQAGSDNLDPDHPSSTPWYLTKSCSVARDDKNVHSCKLAKSTFAITIIMLAIFFVHLPVAILSLIAGKRSKHGRNASQDSQAAMTKESPDPEMSFNAKKWELGSVPRSPRSQGVSSNFAQPPMSPVTPRTQAFNKLNHPLPLRSSGVGEP